MTNEDFLKQCKDEGLSPAQIQQARDGLEWGLRIEEVSLYAKKDYDLLQMNSIRLAVKHGLSREEILFISDKCFNGYQMEQLVLGLKDGLTLEQVKKYAGEATASEMSRLRQKLMEETAIQNPAIFGKDYYDNLLRIAEKQSTEMKILSEQFTIIKEFVDKAPAEEPGEPKKELEEVKAQVSNLELRLKEKDKLIDMLMKNKSVGEKKSPRSFFVKKKPTSVIEYMSDMSFHDDQLEQIRAGYDKGLTMDEIGIYAKKKYDAKRMCCMREVLCRNKERGAVNHRLSENG